MRNSDMKLVGDKIRRCSDCRKSDRVAMVETVLNKENYVAIMVMKFRLIILYMACNCIGTKNVPNIYLLSSII